MGDYDIIRIKCGKCGKNMESQTKILGNNNLTIFKVGSKITNKKIDNHSIKLKEKCLFCAKENIIVIEDMKITMVVNFKTKNKSNRDKEILRELEGKAITESMWGDYF